MTEQAKALVGYRILAAVFLIDMVATATLALNLPLAAAVFFGVLTVFNLAFMLATISTVKDAKALK